jgi:hypothetical protein
MGIGASVVKALNRLKTMIKRVIKNAGVEAAVGTFPAFVSRRSLAGIASLRMN